MLQAHLPTHLLDRWATCVLPGRWIPLPANHVELSLHLRSHPRHPCCGETSAGLANIPHFGESGSAVRLLCSHACPLLETRERLSRLRARGWISTSPRGSNRICTTVPLLDSRPALGAQVRLGACEARLGATLGIECKGTKLGDSVTLSPSGNAQPRGRGGDPCLAPSREGSSPPRPAKTGLRYGAPPPSARPTPRGSASTPVAPQSHTAPTPSPPPREKPRPQPQPQSPVRSACRRGALRVTDAGGPPTARRALPLVCAGTGSAVIGPARGRGSQNELAGWRGVVAGAGDDLPAREHFLPGSPRPWPGWRGGAKPSEQRVAGPGPAAPWCGPSARGA